MFPSLHSIFHLPGMLAFREPITCFKILPSIYFSNIITSVGLSLATLSKAATSPTPTMVSSLTFCSICLFKHYYFLICDFVVVIIDLAYCMSPLLEFFNDPTDVGRLISGSSAFSKSTLNIEVHSGQGATVRNGYGTTNWFQRRK